jgi:glycosyltransferase involved in cell wall biosynthesis
VKVSVVISVYNREQYIKECIESILEQDFKDFELIIIDDGSTDMTLKSIKNFKDERLKIINLPHNCGIGTAKNIGLSAVKGEYIAIMDSDDIAFPSRLSKQVAFLDQNRDIDVLGARGVIINETKDNIDFATKQPVLDGEIKARMLFLNGSAVLHPTMMIRSEFLRKHHLFYENKKQDEDHQLWIRCIAYGAKFHNLPEELIYKRRHDNNVTKELKATNWGQERKILLRMELLGMYYPELSTSKIKHIAEIFNIGAKIDVLKAFKGINAIEEALLEHRSFYGESKQYLHAMLVNIRKEMLQKILQKNS